MWNITLHKDKYESHILILKLLITRTCGLAIFNPNILLKLGQIII